jgi:phytoene synthase
MSPDQYCQQKAVASGSSFYYAFLFLPPERRRAITALYAFCREVDDIVDDCADPQLAATKLGWWRAEIGNLFAGRPQHPVTQALQPAVRQYGVTAERLNEILDGMAMDLSQTRYLDFAALERYCYLVAGVVGALAAGIFGFRDPLTLEYARTLGIAFQLTNIIRDVGEDARKGRVYLPQEDLRRFGVTVNDLRQGHDGESFRRLMEFQAQRAQEHYARAYALLPAADRRAQRPGLIMAAIYRALLDEIERDGYRVLTQRTSLTPLRKLWIAWKTWVLA